MLQTKQNRIAERRNAKPRKTAGLVLAALAAVCCFQVNLANAQEPIAKQQIEPHTQIEPSAVSNSSDMQD